MKWKRFIAIFYTEEYSIKSKLCGTIIQKQRLENHMIAKESKDEKCTDFICK